MDQKKLESLIEQGESHMLEFKENYSSSIAKEICALANAKGGAILLGVDDNGHKRGIKINNKLKSQIHDLTRNFDPNLEVALDSTDDIMIVNVPEGTNKPYSVNGHFYMRYGTNSQQLNRDEIREFFHSEGLIRFDEKPNQKFDLECDFSENAYNEFIARAGISKLLEKKTLFDNLELYDQGKIRNAGVLLFCNSIIKFFPSATITCITFQGKERLKILDRKEFNADILANFQNSLNYLKEKLNTEYIIRGGGPRDEKLELPEEALREALLNAIAHRDYFATTSIFVEIYLDRVEIVNPGGLVKGLNLEELGEISKPRNTLLFGLMQRMNLVEKAGTGIKRMIDAMHSYGLSPMKLIPGEFWFKVIFDRPKTSYEQRIYTEDNLIITPQKTPQKTPQIFLTGLEQKILDRLRIEQSLSRNSLAEKLSISPETVKEYLAKLKAKGVLRRIGPDKGGYWEVME